jgi:hypothetical protein
MICFYFSVFAIKECREKRRGSKKGAHNHQHYLSELIALEEVSEVDDYLMRNNNAQRG